MQEIIQGLSNLVAEFGKFTKANPVMASIVALYGGGLLAWVMKDIPAKLWGFIKTQTTTHLTFTNAQTGRNEESFQQFLTWFKDNHMGWQTRSVSMDGKYDWDEEQGESTGHGTVVGPGMGRHYFFYRGRLMWMDRTRLNQQTGSSQYQINYEIEITMLGRKQSLLYDLIEEFRYHRPDNQLTIYQYNKEWDKLANVHQRELSTVVINQDTMDDLLGAIDRFHASEQWYVERGIPYKKTIMLEGPSGSGKSSLIRALAAHYRKNIYVISLPEMTDRLLVDALASVKPNGMVMIEDFDSSAATRSRGHLYRSDTETPTTDKPVNPSPSETTPVTEADSESGTDSLARMMERLTLSGLLNALDGIVTLHGQVIFLTTNVKEGFDPALIRKGRIDHRYVLAELEDTEIRRYIKLMFPTATLNETVVFSPIMGCNLQALYMEHRDDVDAFIAAIPQQPWLKTVLSEEVPAPELDQWLSR